MKKYLLTMLTLSFLSGCSMNTTANETIEEISDDPIPAEIAEPEMEPEVEDVETLSTRDDGIRHAWTDYSEYAQPNEDGYAYYIYNDPDISSEIFPLDDETSPDVLLFTFDDAPQMPESYAIDIANVLKEKDVNAIFLVNGMYLESEEGQRITEQIHAMGFEIGNHTTTHPTLRELTYEEQYDEIYQTNLLIEEITGEPVRWFRPPFGLFNLDTILICNELGLQLMTWSFGYDWMDEYLSGPELAEVSLNNDYIRSGANILMHDRSWTLEALPTMIDGYRAKGYHIVDPYLIQHQENSTNPL